MNAPALIALGAALLSGCFGLDHRATTDTASADGASFDTAGDTLSSSTACEAKQGNLHLSVDVYAGDPLIAYLIVAPRVRERHAPITLDVSWRQWNSGWELEELVVVLDDAQEIEVAVTDLEVVDETDTRRATRVALDSGVGVPVEVRARFAWGDQACDASDALEPLPDVIGARVTAAALGADGTLWTGTLLDGLIGHGVDGRTLDYRGVYSFDPYEPTWAGPQSQLVMTLARQGARGMWLGTATTGISWFDPGPAALDPSDDVWLHHQPPAPEDESLKELRETVTVVAPDGEAGLYVGTLDGLWYVRHDGDPAAVTWTRLASGVVFAVAPLDDGRVLAGFTTVVAPEALADTTLAASWALAEAPLLVLDVAGTPDDPDDDAATWLQPGDATGVISLWARPDGVLLGTDHGLFAWRPDDQEDPILGLLTVVGPDLAVTSLDGAGDGVWVAARSSCDPEAGLLARVQLDLTAADPVTAIVPVDLEGHGIPPHVSLVRALDGGDLLVSTLVADTSARDLTPPACVESLDPAALDVDTWLLPGDGGPASPL
ncbi:MAG: hypothetical protein EP329_19225 [Deltaproteobacteria bacterium]|nr:MAG: hypothetical protein EP329_19225 [Deltaproteobacteria bacterium]